MTDKYKFHIDPFGQQPGLWNLYTQLTFCFPLADASANSKIVTTLREGLESITAAFPWIAGQVIQEINKSTDYPYYVIRPFEDTPRFVIKHLEDELPSFDVFERSRFPISLIDENLVAPRNTKSISDDSDPKPVFLLQATFITGGLLLTFAAQHGSMDIVGQAEMIKYLSQACHGTPFTTEQISLGNRDRRTIVLPLDTSEVQTTSTGDKVLQIMSSTSSSPASKTEVPSMSPKPPTQVNNVWANFSLSSGALKDLKASAMSTITSGFVTTDDALSAFTWQCISRSRLPHVKLADSSTFARAIDLRRFLDIPSAYSGNLATKTFTTCIFQDLVQEPLGTIASPLRASIDPKALAYEARASVTAQTLPNRNNTPSKPARDLSKDIAFSSWAKISDCWDLNFNLGLGKPKAVRRPSFAPPNEQPMEGVAYLLPKRPDGEIVVTICLREDDMQRLSEDKDWSRYACYIG